MGILVYESRAKEDRTPAELTIYAFQPGSLIQPQDLEDAYNLNTMLTNSTGQDVLLVSLPSETTGLRKNLPKEVQGSPAFQDFCEALSGTRDELANLFHKKP